MSEAMSGEVGGGDALLRERLREANVESRHPNQTNLYMRSSDIDWVLAEIAAAGYVVVDADRYERLREVVAVFADNRIIGPLGDAVRVGELLLQPGDLEPIVPAEVSE